jgi:biopolymer transport protein TolR
MALKPQSLSPSGRGRIGTSLSEINVTPFIDVMLVLLVIFMVTALMMQSGTRQLPQAETQLFPPRTG